MKVIIAGSRHLTLEEIYETVVKAAFDSGFSITEVVSGQAEGVDAAGELFAENQGLAIKLFPADWKKHGNAAGPIRNKQMAQYADALIAIWDGSSRGTANMISHMERAKKPIFKVQV